MSWAACKLIGRPFSVSPADPPNLAGAGVRSCDEQRKLEFEAEPAKQAPPTQSHLCPRQRTIRYALRVLTFGQCRLFQDPGDYCQVPTIPVRHRVGRSPSAKRLRPRFGPRVRCAWGGSLSVGAEYCASHAHLRQRAEFVRTARSHRQQHARGGPHAGMAERLAVRHSWCLLAAFPTSDVTLGPPAS